MANVLIVVYLLIVLAMIGVILMQRSEGGALGIGGGGGGGFMTARGSANLLTRTTAILAALFMATAIALSIINGADTGSQGILDAAAQAGAGSSNVLEALDSLQGDTDADLAVPEVPPADAPAADTGAQDAPETDAPAASDSPDLALPDGGN
jgi:preprotein translocase subunit SecG